MARVPVILVVEDDGTNRMLARRILTARGFEVVEAVDGEDALRRLAELTPDLVLMDLSLPGIDGWTVTRRLRQEERLAHLWVIAVTAHAMSGDRERALEAGCNDYLTKPYRPAELTAAVERGLAAHANGGTT